MILGYNTNGLAHHELFDAVELLAGIGYRGVAITIDHGVLNPYSHGFDSQVDKLRRLAGEHGLEYVVETGARFLLDPRKKHEPTLVSAAPGARARRIEFLKRAVDAAKLIDARCVSLWSGVVREGASRPEATDRLIEGLIPVIRHAERKGVTLAFEPEPGMLIETLADFADLRVRLSDADPTLPPMLATIDIGHLHCTGETPIAKHLQTLSRDIANVHIEDMRAGVHEHLMFGEGEIDFPPVVEALRQIGYDGVVGVELSRHSHDGANAAQRAFDFLSPLLAPDS